MTEGINFDWITRGHDASITPYMTFTVGGQVGSQVLADAVGGVSIGYYVTSDMRSLRVGEASEGLLGWSVYGGGGAGLGVGGSFAGSIGFQSNPLLSRRTWVSATGSAGASIGIGVSAGISKAYPVFNSQFKRKLIMKNRIFVCLLILLLVIIVANTYIQSRSEFLVNYNFKVSKIEISPTRSLTVYDNDKKIDFRNFSIREVDDIKIGDRFFKDICSQYLYIFRRDDNGVEELYIQIKENGVFPYGWFCS